MNNTTSSTSQGLNRLKQNPLARGLYQNGPSKRYLYALKKLTPAKQDILLVYIEGRSFKHLKIDTVNHRLHLDKKTPLVGRNIESTDVLDWFYAAKFLGAEPNELVNGH